MKKTTIAILFLLGLFSFIQPTGATDTLVLFNFYEGIRHKDQAKPAVASAYYLKPMSAGNLVFKTRQTAEKKKLKRIYNLKGLKQLLEEKWGWKEGETGVRFRTIVLSGHGFRVQLKPGKQAGDFRLTVHEKNKATNQNSLDTEMTLPEDNTAIFGFEDSNGKIYFLSFYREGDQKVIQKESMRLRAEQVPELSKRVEPVYPPQAIQKQLEGFVVMEVSIDKQGKVTAVKVTGGKHPVLNKAAVTAVKQWKYHPFVSKGKAKAVTFTVVLDFYFN